MKITLSPEFLTWFNKTNKHLFEAGELPDKELHKEVNEYVSDVLLEHMEMLESDLDILEQDDSPDSGFSDEDGGL